MELCNNAFEMVAGHMNDVLGSLFEVSPRGDKNRMQPVADQLMHLLTRAFFSLTWLNTQYYMKHTAPITDSDYNTLNIAS